MHACIWHIGLCKQCTGSPAFLWVCVKWTLTSEDCARSRLNLLYWFQRMTPNFDQMVPGVSNPNVIVIPRKSQQRVCGLLSLFSWGDQVLVKVDYLMVVIVDNNFKPKLCFILCQTQVFESFMLDYMELFIIGQQQKYNADCIVLVKYCETQFHAH